MNHTKWTPLKVLEEFKLYSTPNEARTKAYGAWKAMLRITALSPGFKEKALAHMKSHRNWSKVDLSEEIKPYRSLSDVMEKNPALYHHLLRLSRKDKSFLATLKFNTPLTFLKAPLVKEVFETKPQHWEVSISKTQALRLPSHLSFETLKSLAKDRLYACGYFKHYHYEITTTLRNPNLLHFTLTLSTREESCLWTADLKSLSNLVISPFLEWAQVESRELIKTLPREIKPRLVSHNDKFISLFLKDKNFKVKEDGSIWERKNKLWLKKTLSFKDDFSYIRYQRKHLSVSRIMYAKFKGPLDDKLFVVHLDHNKRNNRPENLSLLGPGETNKLAFKSGKRKAVKGNAKLTEAHLIRIRELRAKSLSYLRILIICSDEGIPVKSKGHLSDIFNGRIWK